MEAITARLQQLQQLESSINAERISVIDQRRKEDDEMQSKRLQEDAEWRNRMEARDREEDELLLRKRELSRLSLLWTPAVEPSVSEQTSPVSEQRSPVSGQTHTSNDLSELAEDTVSRLGTDEQPSTTPVQSSTSKRSKKGGRTPYKSNQGFPQSSDALGPLFLRKSDNQLVHLHCCVLGCEKAYFKTVTSLMNHIASSLFHGFGKGFLKDHDDAIEKCGRAPGIDEEYVQVQPRDTVKNKRHRPSASRNSSANTVLTTSSLVRVSRNGAFGTTIHESTPDFPPPDPSRSHNNTGTRLLRPENEANFVYEYTSTNDTPTNQDLTSMGLSSGESTPVPDTAAHAAATETLFPDMGPMVRIKQETRLTSEEPLAMKMWSDTVRSSAMSMPAESIETRVRHERAATTGPERKIGASPRGRKPCASAGLDGTRDFF